MLELPAAGSFTIAAPHGNAPVAVLERFGGAGPGTAPVSVGGYHHRQFGRRDASIHGVANTEELVVVHERR